MRRKILAVAIVALLVVGAFAFGGWGRARHSGRGKTRGGFGAFGKIEEIADEIGLTDRQLDEIEQIKLEEQKKLIDLRAEVQKSQIDLRALMSDVEAKSSDIEIAYKNLQANQQALELERVRMMLRIRDVLSVNQRARAKDIMKEKIEERREKIKEHRLQGRKEFQHHRRPMGGMGFGPGPGFDFPPETEEEHD